jgi:phosphatidylinositol-3-phosphatase
VCSYAAKHVPFLYYADVGGNAATCANRVVDYTSFAADLAAGSIRYSFIAPDLCHDMHDSCAPTNEPIQQGDTWLPTNVPPIIAKMQGTDVLFIVWDEQDTFVSTSVPLFVVSPIAKRGPTATAYTHESLLGTIEEGMGLTRLGGAATASLITDVWK